MFGYLRNNRIHLRTFIFFFFFFSLSLLYSSQHFLAFQIYSNILRITASFLLPTTGFTEFRLLFSFAHFPINNGIREWIKMKQRISLSTSFSGYFSGSSCSFTLLFWASTIFSQIKLKGLIPCLNTFFQLVSCYNTCTQVSLPFITKFVSLFFCFFFPSCSPLIFLHLMRLIKSLQFIEFNLSFILFLHFLSTLFCLLLQITLDYN